MRKWWVGLALTAGLAAFAAGCGSSGGGDSLTKAEFITQADAICTQAHNDENAVQFPQVDPAQATDEQLEQLGDAIAQATDIDRKEVDDLRKLKPPEDFEDTWEEALRELDEGLDHAEEAVDEANKHDAAGVTRELNAVTDKANEANLKAKAYGLKVCGAS